jgi:sugar phosphate isomerase/epimerase
LRIALATASLYLYPLRRVFALAKNTGFEGLEVVLCPELRARGSKYVRGLSQEYGLPIFGLHPPMIPIPRRIQHHKLLPQMIPVAQDLACQYIVIHAPKARALNEGLGPEYVEAVVACVEELKGTSTRLCVENQAVFRPSDRQYALSPYRELWRFVEEHDLAVTLDTSHAASFPYDLLEAYQTLRDRLVNVHLSDFRQGLPIPPWFNLHSFFKHHQVPGSGDLPLRPLLERLRTDGYQGLITVEVSPVALEAWRPHRVQDNLLSCLDFVKSALAPA